MPPWKNRPKERPHSPIAHRGVRLPSFASAPHGNLETAIERTKGAHLRGEDFRLQRGATDRRRACAAKPAVAAAPALPRAGKNTTGCLANSPRATHDRRWARRPLALYPAA